MTDITRRRLLAGTALVAGAGTLVDPLAAAAPPAGAQVPGLYRYKVGDFELTAIYDGVWYRPIDDKFVRNAPYGDVQRAMADAFMPAEKLATPFTTLLVNTGAKLILLDTGTGGQVAPTAGFPNAEIMVPAPEWEFWMDDANLRAAPGGLKGVFLNFRRVFADIAEDVTRYQPGIEVATGLATIPAYGHTPGHTVFALQSGRESILVLSDTTQHPALFARHPEWQPAFDIDGPLAVATRKKLLDRVAADRMLVTGYHFPFPACGHIVKTADGYEHVPMLWEPTL